jgi:hypothetical protein
MSGDKQRLLFRRQFLLDLSPFVVKLLDVLLHLPIVDSGQAIHLGIASKLDEAHESANGCRYKKKEREQIRQIPIPKRMS